MNLPLAALILVLLLGIWLIIRLRKGATVKKPVKPASSSANAAFHAVSIKFPSNACKAARDLAGRRFLSNAAPKLPLPECDVLECSCRFMHHKDRRSSQNRRSPFGPSGFGSATGKHETEQRKGEDRRHRDEDDYF